MRNNANFVFHFYRLGEWHQVSVDRTLPVRRRALPSKTGEWWVPLVEKAYAKFNGSYDNINGGVTTWSLSDMTGGVAVRMDLTWANVEAIGVTEFKEFIQRYLERNAIFTTSNDHDYLSRSTGEVYESNGLVKGHAYSLLSVEDVLTRHGPKCLVKLRNPHGQTEWKGKWADNSSKWELVDKETQAKIGYKWEHDGGFFMAFEDWVNQFEIFTMCYIPYVFGENEYYTHQRDNRVLGTLVPGLNCGYKMLEHNLQFLLTLNHPQDVWIQLLHDAQNPKEESYTMLNIYQRETIPDERIDLQYVDKSLHFVDSFLPRLGKNRSCQYSQNGFCYRLQAGTYFMMAAFNVPSERKFMIRVIADSVDLKLLQ